MVDMSTVIGHNIREAMRSRGFNVSGLAVCLGVSPVVIRSMLDGSRLVSASELRRVADVLGTTTECLSRVSNTYCDSNFVSVFGSRVNSEGGLHALQVADTLSDMILFHSRVRRNGESALCYDS